ncbi:hypothetical protein JIP62_00955 [Brevundimonas vitis]|uniref:Uncharacterized protein n=1 Tax=Brevundimonas vitisensis TaxID=2800818 RepID=A0ABX7BND4_9CAUL|nr:hypothetical protein [Brevundimonas vitisensis]QQQ18752.1 hypothetical protein JIP62_00955 [Brevundimonas vitisensis]
MAVEQYVFLNESQMPSADVVSDRARALGHDFVVTEAVNLREHRGYLPIKLEGAQTGFEAYFMPTGEIDELPPEAGQWSHLAMTITGGNSAEALAATIYLRAIADLTSGPYWYPDDDIQEPANVPAYLDDAIASFKVMAAKDAARAARRQASQPVPEPPIPQSPKSGFFSRLLGSK